MNTTLKIVQVDHLLWRLQNARNHKNNSKKFEIPVIIFIFLFYVIDDEKYI